MEFEIKQLTKVIATELHRWQRRQPTLKSMYDAAEGWIADINNIAYYGRGVKTAQFYTAVKYLNQALEHDWNDPNPQRIRRGIEHNVTLALESLKNANNHERGSFTPIDAVKSAEQLYGDEYAALATSPVVDEDIKIIKTVVGGFVRAGDMADPRLVREAKDAIEDMSTAYAADNEIQDLAVSAIECLDKAIRSASIVERQHYFEKAQDMVEGLEKAIHKEHNPYQATLDMDDETKADGEDLIDELRNYMYRAASQEPQEFLPKCVHMARQIKAFFSGVKSYRARRKAEDLYNKLVQAENAARITGEGWYIPEIKNNYDLALSSMSDLEDEVR